MSSSEENSDPDSDLELECEFLEETYDNGNNAFAFEPEYPEHEVDERLRVYMQEREGDDGNEPLVIADPGDDWCRCENCIQMTNTPERICCQASSEIIAEKVESHKCISHTDGFRDVCLNRNVLEAALGSWSQMTDEPVEKSNKSYRFIAYRQYISWIFGWLGKDVRKVIPSCVVNKIRITFPEPDNNYVPYKDSPFA